MPVAVEVSSVLKGIGDYFSDQAAAEYSLDLQSSFPPGHSPQVTHGSHEGEFWPEMRDSKQRDTALELGSTVGLRSSHSSAQGLQEGPGFLLTRRATF